jgi:hypothetical protein
MSLAGIAAKHARNILRGAIMATYKQITEYVKAKYNYTPKPCWIADVKEQMGFHVPYAHNRKDKKARKHPCPKNKIEDIKEAIMQ